MKNESDVRVCKNKKCQKVLPEGYKHRYCEACRNKHAQGVDTFSWYICLQIFLPVI